MLVSCSQINFKEATDFLKNQDMDLCRVIMMIGACRLKIEKQPPYVTLLHAIAGQQLHNKAVQAILNRLKNLGGGSLPDPEQLLRFNKEQLRTCGFSFRKIDALCHLASATLEGIVPSYEQAQKLSDQELIDRLVQLPGIGRWTVEMVLIFTLGRMDIMPVDDFGIREGWRICKNLPQQPSAKLLKNLTAGWSPYRSVGAWYLWQSREILEPNAQ